MRLRSFLLAAPLSLGMLPGILLAAPASAEVVTSDPSQFVQTLSDEAFQTLRSGNQAAARTKFRTLLQQYFAIDEIGDRLIRRWKPTITPAQYAAYKAALPGYIIGSYADNLYSYANAKLTVVRAQNSGASAAVLTHVTKPGGQPITAIWTVTNSGSGYKISNLTVGGINLAVTQSADFDSYVQRNGFDKLVAFMKSRA
ncbi:MAG: ABC transporter substrate-binding protein [Sphingomonadaceae bacterium]|nr:ABC transporter substrate-binding protein [Sphingomonadaceae bacterium]